MAAVYTNCGTPTPRAVMSAANIQVVGNEDESMVVLPAYVQTLQVQSEVDYNVVLASTPTAYQIVSITWNNTNGKTITIRDKHLNVVYSSEAAVGAISFIFTGMYWSLLSNSKVQTFDNGLANPESVAFVSYTENLEIGDTVTINGVTYTCAAETGPHEFTTVAELMDTLVAEGYTINVSDSYAALGKVRGLFTAGAYARTTYTLFNALNYNGMTVTCSSDKLSILPATFVLASVLFEPTQFTNDGMSLLERVADMMDVVYDSATVNIANVVPTDTITVDSELHTFVAADPGANELLVSVEAVQALLESKGYHVELTGDTVLSVWRKLLVSIEFSAHGVVTYTAPAGSFWNIIHNLGE